MLGKQPDGRIKCINFFKWLFGDQMAISRTRPNKTFNKFCLSPSSVTSKLNQIIFIFNKKG